MFAATSAFNGMKKVGYDPIPYDFSVQNLLNKVEGNEKETNPGKLEAL